MVTAAFGLHFDVSQAVVMRFTGASFQNWLPIEHLHKKLNLNKNSKQESRHFIAEEV
jgi:TRAP-type uncharacterized transport system substrate-binding protein